MVDLNASSIPALLPLLRLEFGLNYAALAAIVMVSNLTSSVIQPLFGALTDRRYFPWLLAVAPVLASVGAAALGFASSYSMLLLFVALAGMGVSAYHPEASRGAYTAAGDQRVTGMSIFSVGGNIGYAFGPLVVALGAALIGGVHGTLLFLPLGLIAGMALWRRLGRQRVDFRQHGRPAGEGAPLWGVMLLVFVVFLRSAAQVGVMSFLPLYLANTGAAAGSAGIVLFFFLLAGAVGTMVGGPISDRYGRKLILVVSFMLAAPLLYVLPHAHGLLLMVALLLLGFVVVATFSTTVVLAQEFLPKSVGMAAGLTLGFAIGAGGFVVLALGQYADLHGVRAALDLLWWLPVIGVLGSWVLPIRPRLAAVA